MTNHYFILSKGGTYMMFHIEGEIKDPVKEGAHVLKPFLRMYIENENDIHIPDNVQVSCFLSEIQTELLKYIKELEEFNE